MAAQGGVIACVYVVAYGGVQASQPSDGCQIDSGAKSYGLSSVAMDQVTDDSYRILNITWSELFIALHTV